MDRLTEWHDGRPYLKTNTDEMKQRSLRRLAEYEDAEDKGLLHIAPIPNGTTIYVWQQDADDWWFVYDEAYLFGVTEYHYGEFGKDFFISEEECRKHPHK